MAYGSNSAPLDGSPVKGGGGDGPSPLPPARAEKRKRWSLRTSANLMIGVTGALWALVAVILKVLF